MEFTCITLNKKILGLRQLMIVKDTEGEGKTQ